MKIYMVHGKYTPLTFVKAMSKQEAMDIYYEKCITYKPIALNKCIYKVEQVKNLKQTLEKIETDVSFVNYKGYTTEEDF